MPRLERGRSHAFGERRRLRPGREVGVRGRAHGEGVALLADDDRGHDGALGQRDESGAKGGDHFFENVVMDGGRETRRVRPETECVCH